MLKLLLPLLLLFSLQAKETNSTAETNSTRLSKEHQENNASAEEKKRIEKEIEEQMKREEKYAKEQVFYQGDDYNLKEHEVDVNSLPDVPVLEPDYDFDMTDVYRDDL